MGHSLCVELVFVFVKRAHNLTVQSSNRFLSLFLSFFLSLSGPP
jgi:hypothetical protein